MTVSNPLSYLSEQLENWRKAGTYQRLRELQGPCEPVTVFDGQRGDQPRLQQLSRPGQPSRSCVEAADSRRAEVRRRIRRGAHHLRHHEPAHGARERIAAFKNVEACVVFQSGFAANAGTVSAILDARGPHHLRRAEPRQHHRRLPAFEGQDPRLPAQGRRPRRARSWQSLRDVPGRKLLITDGVFSMDGDIGPLPGAGRSWPSATAPS